MSTTVAQFPWDDLKEYIEASMNLKLAAQSFQIGTLMKSPQEQLDAVQAMVVMFTEQQAAANIHFERNLAAFIENRPRIQLVH